MRLLKTSVLAAASLILGTTILLAVSARAQMNLTPRVIRIDTFTCAELLSRHGESNDRVLIYFNGFISGMSQQMTWDEGVEGALVERALGYCRTDPSATVFSAFLRASPR